MTERLYYTDSYLREFEACVVGVRAVDGRDGVILDRTGFYPTSGGQPFDTGTLGEVRVIDVVEADDGSLVHVIDGMLAEGTRVVGRIDWDRRFDHMQQHTGQHVLSAAADALLQARTESFHLGSMSATIDLSRELTPGEIRRVEAEANRIVWEDRAVQTTFVDADQAAALPLRKESARAGTLRIVDVEGFDLSACGGTHVARTGAIGIIAVASWEKFRGGTRLEFLCGGRVLRGYRELRDTAESSIRLLSVVPAELPAAIERLQADAKDARRRINEMQLALARHEANALAAAAGDSRTVVHVMEGWDQPGLKAIASAICQRPGHAAVLLGTPAPCALVVARAADGAIDAAAVLRKLVDRFGGKGGGRADLAQGGGLLGDPAEMAAFARTLLLP